MNIFIQNFETIIKTKKLIENFVSCKHTKQTRIFGFITTNIRNVGSFVDYIKELVPVYIKYEKNNDLDGWQKYCIDNILRDKQKYKRLEEAKILFRNVKDNLYLNNNAKILYNIEQNYGANILELFLSFYILTGKYFDTEKQPIVEIEKIINSYNGNILKDSIDCLINDIKNKLFFATLFYNKTNDLFIDMAYYLLEHNEQYLANELNYLKNYIKNQENILIGNINSKKKNAGGINNFKYDIFLIVNYFLFKNCSNKYQSLYQTNKIEFIEKVFTNYVNIFFENNLNKFLNIDTKDKEKLINLFCKNENIITDIFYSTLSLTEENIIEIVNKKRSQNIKIESMEKYGYKCFMHYCHCDEEIHNKTYFKNKKGKTYLEAHHIIQIENSKLFKNSLDVVDNVIPLCPNCHRKIHNAENKEVAKILKIIYNNLDKKSLIKQGIFVDLNTLSSFYGLDDIEGIEK